MTYRLPLSVLILSMAFVLPTLATAQTADQVVLVPNSTLKAPGGRFRGQITAETPTEVKLTLGATVQAIPVEQIATILYAGMPPTMARAESRENAGALGEAAELYRQSAVEAAAKPFIVTYAQFSQARLIADVALADPAKVNEAMTLLDGFTKANPSSRHIIPALELLTRLQLVKGNAEAAAKTIDALAKFAPAADRAAVLRARVLAKKGDHDAAISEFDKLISGAAEGSAKKREGQLARAESLAALKRYDEATKALEGVIQTTPAEDYVAQSAAYNTLGDCLRSAGKPKEALYAYLHTDVLYAKDKEQHPKALAQIVQLWRVLKREDRADEALDRLKQEYPQSPYLAAAAAAAAK